MRRFGKLSLKCLLYRQAEITWLEGDIEFLERKCRDSNDSRSLTSWKHLVHANGDANKMFHREKVVELQLKLEGYRMSLLLSHKIQLSVTDGALLQTAEVFKLLHAQPADLQVLRDWLARPVGGDHFLDGTESAPWNNERHAADLVALMPPTASDDRLALTLRNRTLPWYHKWLGHHGKPRIDLELGEIWEYDAAGLTLAGNVLCMILSFAIPTVSIFTLYFVQSMLARLLILSGFLFVFSFSMMFVAGHKRGEVFAATAAFAAIQVVFVGGVNIIQDR